MNHEDGLTSDSMNWPRLSMQSITRTAERSTSLPWCKHHISVPTGIPFESAMSTARRAGWGQPPLSQRSLGVIGSSLVRTSLVTEECPQSASLS